MVAKISFAPAYNVMLMSSLRSQIHWLSSVLLRLPLFLNVALCQLYRSLNSFFVSSM